MSGRIYVVILFFWALITIVTPTLVRLSAPANIYGRFDGDQRREGVKLKLSLPRRALIAATVSPAPTPVPEGGFSGGEGVFSGEFVRNHVLP